ncbi:SOS response-associated peptidase family protein [Sphingomonas xanthus]|uniref:Abasic site processing protein n=1 Tax=Sphingomonas xanthus TaxID=2594473 RepID=A0A516IRU6_9SPHN|nr:SOS response-associated peptidase family protein [Sphingomonas xanthus]QDP19589.1 SOS response-associated peptidase [Sphingomonas xanthus]
MCNLYRLHRGTDAIRQLFAEQGFQLSFPEGAPNLELRDVRITDRAPIVQAAGDGYALVERRWSWPSSYGKPLYNLRSEGRNFPQNRCLVVADGFYEYTTPADPKQKRKDRWLFTPTTGTLLGIAGITRESPGVGAAFTLLTAEPGPDVAPLHSRQIVLLDPADWAGWLSGEVPSRNLLKPTPAGFLKVEPT